MPECEIQRASLFTDVILMCKFIKIPQTKSSRLHWGWSERSPNWWLDLAQDLPVPYCIFGLRGPSWDVNASIWGVPVSCIPEGYHTEACLYWQINAWDRVELFSGFDCDSVHLPRTIGFALHAYRPPPSLLVGWFLNWATRSNPTIGRSTWRGQRHELPKHVGGCDCFWHTSKSYREGALGIPRIGA